MSESVQNIKDCKVVIENHQQDETTKFIVFGLKQIFVDFFITVEDFTSIMLKELKQFKIGMDMKKGLEILKENKVIDEEEYKFLSKARLLRNRILHRYKEPSREELFEFMSQHEGQFDKVLMRVKRYIN